MFRKLKKKNRSRHHTLNKKTNIDAVALWSKSISDDKELSETGFFTIFEVALAEGFSGSPPLGAAPASGHALLPPVSTLARTVLSHSMSSPLSTLSPRSCPLIYINWYVNGITKQSQHSHYQRIQGVVHVHVR